MARKVATKKPDDAIAERHGPVTPAELREGATMLNEKMGELISLAAAIEKSGLPSVSIDGLQKFNRGSGLIEEYIATVEYELRLKKNASK